MTLYDLGNLKDEVREELAKLLRGAGLAATTAVVYDASDVLSSLRSWRYKGKERYIELFEVVREVLTRT